jgi:ketosteroid isomerase-like protein
MTQKTNETQIREVVEKWAKAVRGKDVDGAIAHHTRDILMFDVPMPLQARGLDEYKKTWELFFASNRGGPGSFDVMELQITASETAGYCHAIVKIFESRVRLTMGLRKEAGQWLIAHEHHSYPIELKS